MRYNDMINAAINLLRRQHNLAYEIKQLLTINQVEDIKQK